MSDSDQERQLPSGTDVPSDAPTDVEESKRDHADEDAALAAKVAAGHEPSDLRVRPLLWIAVGTFAFLGLVGVTVLGLFNFFQGQPMSEGGLPTGLSQTSVPPPPPNLQVDPSGAWQAFQATEEATLNGYGWADRGAGVVRIPIDRAIELLAERGMPTTVPTTLATPQPAAATPGATGATPQPAVPASGPATGQLTTPTP